MDLHSASRCKVKLSMPTMNSLVHWLDSQAKEKMKMLLLSIEVSSKWLVAKTILTTTKKSCRYSHLKHKTISVRSSQEHTKPTLVLKTTRQEVVSCWSHSIPQVIAAQETRQSSMSSNLNLGWCQTISLAQLSHKTSTFVLRASLLSPTHNQTLWAMQRITSLNSQSTPTVIPMTIIYQFSAKVFLTLVLKVHKKKKPSSFHVSLKSQSLKGISSKGLSTSWLQTLNSQSSLVSLRRTVVGTTTRPTSLRKHMKRLEELMLAKSQRKIVRPNDLKIIFARFSSVFCIFTYLS